MKRKACKIAVAAMVVFLSTIFLVDTKPSCAASGKKKVQPVTRMSAGDHAEARIKELQGALKIDDAQEVLWNNLTQVMRENAKEMDVLAKDRVENSKTMNAVEMIKFQNRISEARLDQLKKFIPPFEALYASMSDEQKKSTDTLFRTGKHGKHKIK